MLPHQNQRIRQHIQRHRQPPPRLPHHELILLKFILPVIEDRHRYHSFAAVSSVTPFGAAGPFQRRMGSRPAVVSSSRCTRVVCGAVCTSSGFSSASRAICFNASISRSSSSRLSLSVGSIIIAPCTTSENETVYAWKP